jgi:hypothetical protein
MFNFWFFSFLIIISLNFVSYFINNEKFTTIIPILLCLNFLVLVFFYNNESLCNGVIK